MRRIPFYFISIDLWKCLAFYTLPSALVVYDLRHCGGEITEQSPPLISKEIERARHLLTSHVDFKAK